VTRLAAAIDTPSRWRVVGIFVVAAAFAAIDLRAGIGPHDEGLMLQWGRRIGSGEWPYRDFWCNYLPGQPLLQALLGDSLVLWRVVRVLTGAAAATLAYVLVRREAGSERWALAACAAVATALAWPLTPGPNGSAVALAFAALVAARRHPALAGAVAGVCGLFRPEVGAAAAIGAALLGGGLRPLAAAGAAFGLGLLPFLAVAPGELLSQTFGFAGEQRLQRLPFPLDPETADPNKVLERLFPAVLVAGTALWLAVVAIRRRAVAFVPLVVVGVAYLLARTDEFHLAPLSAVLAVGIAVAAAREQRRGARVALAAVLGLMVLHGLDRMVGHMRDASSMVAVDLPEAGVVRTTRVDAQALDELADEVDLATGPGAPVLVAPPRFDRVRVGAPLLYTLLNRSNPTRYDVMQPGVVTTARVQREMIADLGVARPALVIRWVSPLAVDTEDNGSARSSGVSLLDDWIRAGYRLQTRIGDYELLVRR
jgi:hypothetical protein